MLAALYMTLCQIAYAPESRLFKRMPFRATFMQLQYSSNVTGCVIGCDAGYVAGYVTGYVTWPCHWLACPYIVQICDRPR